MAGFHDLEHRAVMRGGVFHFRVVAFEMLHTGSTWNRPFRSQHGGMGDGIGKQQEKGINGVTDEAFGACRVELRVVKFAGMQVVALQNDRLFLIINEARITEVAVLMTGGAVEYIETFFQDNQRVLDGLLSVAAEIAITEIIGNDEHDVRLRSRETDTQKKQENIAHEYSQAASADISKMIGWKREQRGHRREQRTR